MKIPDSVRIGGVEFKIKLEPNIRDGARLSFGYIDYYESEIQLSTTDGAGHQKRCQILLHEILHGIREHAGLAIENEEEVVNMFAKGLYQVLQDNAGRLFDLKEQTSEDRKE